MEGPISFWGYKEQESNLILPEHHDDGDDDDDVADMETTKFINLQISLRKVTIVFVYHENRNDAQDREMLRNYTIIDILNLWSTAAIKKIPAFCLLSHK
jgi:hypothetical protein